MKNNSPWFTPLKIKLIAGLHIFLQIAFPLALTVNPAVSHAQAHEAAQPTSVYTLRPGETVASVAAKYQLSVQALRALNQLRTFAHGFDNLRAGDELDVPRAIANPQHDASAPASAPSTTQQTAAGLISRVASAPDQEAMTATAFSLASNAVSKQIQQWLEQVGTAQIQLALDKESGLTNSQFDVLIPLAEREDRLIFTQQSLHRTDNRTQGNLGFGYRAFHKEWMVGGNTFFDYDLSRGHRRMGAGVEYWRDFIKLGANSYLRLSNWRDSPDLEDYVERPANGWDLRAQAWLPALPQLGAELVYEQYYGHQVALFGKDHRQRNPHAITLGVNYSPFPLLTFNAARSLGASGNSDTRVGIELRYQPNESWKSQIDPDAAHQMHSLAADRHTLIERNNNIVLDYRKKTLIRLQTAAHITGYTGEEKSLGVVVNSAYGLDKITWSAAALVAAGGEIIQKSATDYSVILPDYQTGPGSINTYTIRGVAVDKQGNASPAAQTLVTVAQGTIDTTKSTFTPTHSQLLADGKTQLQLVLKVNDSQGNPVDISAEEIGVEKVAKLRGEIASTLSTFTRRSPGEYVATLTAGTRVENFTLTPFVRHSRFATANIVLTEDNASARINAGDLVVIKNNAMANGADTNSVKVTVRDAHGNVIPNQTVSFSADNGATIASSGTTGSDGSVTVTLTSTTAGQSNVTAVVNTHAQQLALNFMADNSTARIASGDLVVLKDNAKANGSDINSVKAVVRDAHGNPLAGQTVNFTADNGAIIAASGITDSDGSITVTLTNATAGASSVIARVNGSVQQALLTFVADSSTARIASGDLLVVTDSARANGIDTNTVKAIVTDGFGNRVANLAVNFSADNSGVVAASGTTDASGEVVMTVTSTRAGQSTVTASVDSSVQHQTLTFVPDDSTAQIASGDLVTITDNAKANGSDVNRLKATVTDLYGNVLAGQTVSFTADNGAVIATSGTTGSDGSVTMTLTSKKAGTSKVTAAINGSSQSLTLTFVANSSTARIASGDLVVVSNNAPADGSAVNSVKATVRDEHGNILSGQKVSFTADNGATITASGTTGSDGSVTVTLTSKKAGASKVTAAINGSSQSQTLTFVANSSTARIISGDLVVVSNNALADGSAVNSVKATVRDANGNVLAGQKVSFTADNGAAITASGTTGSDGSVTMTLTSKKAGASKVTAAINGSSQSQTLNFVANSSTARILSGDLVVVSNNALADGSAVNSVKATVRDANGNILPGQKVSFTADNGAVIAASATTGSDGSVTVTLTSRKAGASTVTATVNGSSQSQTLNFVANSSTARINSGDLQIVSNNALADGSAVNSVKATVRDANGNVLAGQTVSFSAGNGAVIAASGTTGSDGSVTMTLTSKKAGASKVTAAINGSSQSQTLNFVANSSTARIASGDLVVVSNNALADGSAVNSVKATVRDANGNVLAGQKVSFTADNGAVIAASATTGSDGSVTMTLTSKKAGASKVTAAINGSSQSQTLTFVANASTARIISGDLQIVSNNALADGSAVNSVKATVRDANGNVLAGQKVSFTADNGAVIATSGTTGSDGSVTVTLTSKKAGASKVTASINGSSQTIAVIFSGDGSKALLASLTIVTNNAGANGRATNSVKATVTDAIGTPLPGLNVSFSANNGAHITSGGATDSDGATTATLTNYNVGQSSVTATINGSSQTLNVTFNPTTYTLAVAQKDFYNASYQFSMLVTNIVGNKLTASSQGILTQEALLGEDLTATCPAGTKKYGQKVMLIEGYRKLRSVYQGVVQFSPFQSKAANSVNLTYSNVNTNDSQNYPLDKITATQWVTGNTYTLTRNTTLGNIKLLLKFDSSTFDIGSFGVSGNSSVNINMGSKRLPLVTSSARQVNYMAGGGPCN